MGGRALALLRRLEGGVLAALLLGMSALYLLNVAVRNLASAYAATFDWLEEATLFGLAWLVFLGLGLTLEAGRHIAMTALFERCGAAARRWIGIVINLIGFVFSLYIAKVGWDITAFVLRSGQISPSLDVSMAWLYAVMPVGFGLLALRYLLELIGVTARYRIAGRGQDH